MELKLKIEKKGLSTTEEVIKEEYTLYYGVVFRGRDGASPRLSDHNTWEVFNDTTGKYEDTGVEARTPHIIHTNHSELVALRDAGQLVAGAFYRITDYQTLTSEIDTKSAGHPFDIIIQAIDSHTLSEKVQAIQREGDTYFAKAKLDAWELKYSLDNNKTRFAWAKDSARNQSWQCAWGVLESKANNDASTNFVEAMIDGVKKYLYRPAEPTSYLQDKRFYRIEGGVSVNVSDNTEVAFVTEETPFDVDVNSLSLFAIHIPTGHILDSFPCSEEWGGDEEYNAGFGDQDSEEGVFFDMITSGSTIELAGQTYYQWFPFGEDYERIDNWISNNNPFNLGGEKKYYEGDVNKLYYAFDSILPKSSKAVTEISDGEKMYLVEGDQSIDHVTYTSYISQEDGGKGVIYWMRDEWNNEARYDFKNILFTISGESFYTFGANDLSLQGTSYGNILDTYKNKGKNLPVVVFKNTAVRNIFRCSLRYRAVFEDVCQSNVIESVSSDIDNIAVSEAMYACSIVNNTKGNITINGRMTGCHIQSNSDCTFKGQFFYCDFFGNGSVAITDTNGNAKMARGLRVVFSTSTASNVRLVSNKTVSSNTQGIVDVELIAPSWGSSEVVVNVDDYISSSAQSVLKIARNSAGVVKCWREVDLIA